MRLIIMLIAACYAVNDDMAQSAGLCLESRRLFLYLQICFGSKYSNGKIQL